MKSLKSKALREDSTRELMAAVVSLISNELTELQRRILTEVLVYNRSFTEVKNAVGLTVPRQKIIFQEGVAALNKGLYNLNNLREAHQNLTEQHKKVLDKFDASEKNELAKFSPEIRQILNTLIEKTSLSHRVYNVCKSLKINRVSDLVRYYRHDFLRVRTCGKQSVIELENFLAKNGLYWGMLK